jgi:ketosteroid isomerase-like protein
MDQATIERIERSYELFNSTGQFEEAFFSPDVEWHNAPEVPGATVHRGRDAVVREIAAQGEAWESRHATPLKILAGSDKAAVFVRGTSQGKASGAPVEIYLVHVWTIEDGMVRRIEVFMEREAALSAAGLGESTE